MDKKQIEHYLKRMVAIPTSAERFHVIGLGYEKGLLTREEFLEMSKAVGFPLTPEEERCVPFPSNHRAHETNRA